MLKVDFNDKVWNEPGGARARSADTRANVPLCALGKLSKNTGVAYSKLIVDFDMSGVASTNDENATWCSANQCYMADPIQHEKALLMMFERLAQSKEVEFIHKELVTA